MEQEKIFENLITELFETCIKIDPIVATYLGIHKYDHLLPDVSRQQILRNIELLENFLKRLKNIDSSKLTGEKRLDYDIADMFLQFNIFWLKELRFWEKDPDYASRVGDAIYPLFSRRFAPVEERAKNTAARLLASEVMLEQAKICITRPVKLWTEIAIETCERMLPFISNVVTSVAPMVDKKLSAKLKEAGKKAIASIKKYEDWLKKDILPQTTEDFTVKKEIYDKLIEKRQLGLSTKEILSLGEKYLKECRERLAKIAEEIKPGASVEEVKEVIRSKHPKTFEEALKVYKNSMEKARMFVVKQDIATMPTKESLEIVETPIFLRHTVPFAVYDLPGAFDEDQTGRYMVTPVEDKPNLLREHNYASIINITVHEGYPGHHLQLVCSNRNPSLIRQLTHLMSYIGTETIEGYAHWVEEFMAELGYEDTPETQFIRMTDMLWRAVRIIVDVKLCTGEMTFDEAVNMLVRETGMERPSAIAEVKRYTLNPSIQLSYLIGKHLIQQLRNKVKRKMGRKYSDKFFIDTIIYSGSAPYEILQRIFDEKTKEQ